MMVPSTNEIDSGAASSMTTFVDEHDKLVPSTIIHSPHQFENIEKQEDSDEESSVSVLDSADFDDESWGFFMLEAILYIPMLMQSVLASMNFARSLLFGEAVMLFLEKRSFHAPWWLQRCQSVFLITNSNVWPPPSFLLLIALTIIALVVHPDGFTWVILRKTRYVYFES